MAGDLRVDVVGALKGDAVSGVVEADDARPRNGAREDVGVPRMNEDVARGAEDQRRYPEAREARARAVAHHRAEVSGEDAPGRAMTCHLGDAPIEPRDVDAREKLGRVEETLQRRDPLLRITEVGLDEAAEPLCARDHRAEPAGMGRDQRQAPHALGARERELLRDHASHRHTDDVGVREPDCVEHASGVARHRRHRRPSLGRVALADSEVIVEDHPVRRREAVRLRAPDRAAHPETHHEEHRGTDVALTGKGKSWVAVGERHRAG